MVAIVSLEHTEIVISKQVEFPSLLSARAFQRWVNSAGSLWRVTEITLRDDWDFNFVPDSGSEMGPLLLNSNFEWQLLSNTPSLGQVKLPDTGDWELWLL